MHFMSALGMYKSASAMLLGFPFTFTQELYADGVGEHVQVLTACTIVHTCIQAICLRHTVLQSGALHASPSIRNCDCTRPSVSRKGWPNKNWIAVSENV